MIPPSTEPARRLAVGLRLVGIYNTLRQASLPCRSCFVSITRLVAAGALFRVLIACGSNLIPGLEPAGGRSDEESNNCFGCYVDAVHGRLRSQHADDQQRH